MMSFSRTHRRSRSEAADRVPGCSAGGHPDEISGAHASNGIAEITDGGDFGTFAANPSGIRVTGSAPSS
jgi:hypothetical protein